ncbi:MAG: 50S ribosomal protein L2 [Canidatus Methanoxibalbensis ujae]|nr:50S ribosomal protein L2 [Candidatus Methanoxibalbensis ujae]MCW7078128.1 50S ribosomal protein L2 [Candidatus Methanoxibalbensis ujae]RLG38684.1 MAG: 50S ribosomal protein L2 [Methanosarcinales archaeon]
MGKRIIAQRRGKGTPTYRSPAHRFRANLEHVRLASGETISCVVEKIVHDPSRSAPIALIRRNGGRKYVIIPEGISEGDEICYGASAELKVGNTLPLRYIPEGTPVCNVELRPGDGGKVARAGGDHATVLAHEGDMTLLSFPSGKERWVSSDCLATIGVVAGGGRQDKPLVKAGKRYHRMRARAAKYPRVRGVAMNPVDHPFGGGSHQHVGRPKTISRGAPPGRKVGSIAASKTGRRKRK